MIHEHSAHKHHSHSEEKDSGIMKFAISATLHCLVGCGIGEVLGVVLGTYWGMSMINTMILAIILGFVFGFALGMIPLLRKGFSFKQSFKIVLIAEGLSIVVMEAFEVATQFLVPGVMEAGLSSPVFWLGMLAGLIVGFAAALPVNYYMIKRGVRHEH